MPILDIKGMRMKWIAVVLVVVTSILTFSTPSHSAEREIKRISRLVPKRNGMIMLGYAYNSDADVRNEPGSFSIQMIRFRGHVPIPLFDNIVFAPGALFDLHHFRLHNTVNYLNQNTLNGYDTGPVLAAVMRFGEDWMLNLNFTPMVSSDMKGFGWKDIQFTGYGLAGWAFSDSASFLFGLAVNKEFWRYLPIPILGFVIRPEGSFFEAEAVLPHYIRADFKVADFCKLFIQGEYEGDVWYIRGDGTVPNHFGKLMESHTGAGARFTVVKGVEIEAWGGVNPFRRVSFKDTAGLTVKERVNMAFFGEANIILTPAIFRR